MNEMAQYYKDINSSQKSTDLIQSQSKPQQKKKKIMKTDNSKIYMEMLEEKKIAKTNLKKRTNLEKLYYHILKFIIKQ